MRETKTCCVRRSCSCAHGAYVATCVCVYASKHACMHCIDGNRLSIYLSIYRSIDLSIYTHTYIYIYMHAYACLRNAYSTSIHNNRCIEQVLKKQARALSQNDCEESYCLCHRPLGLHTNVSPGPCKRMRPSGPLPAVSPMLLLSLRPTARGFNSSLCCSCCQKFQRVMCLRDVGPNHSEQRGQSSCMTFHPKDPTNCFTFLT